MRKKTVFLAAIAVLLAAIAAVGASLAYFTDQKTAQNIFTIGNVEIELTEPGWTDGAKLLPGVPAEKDPTVTNTGLAPCLVRVNVQWPQDVALTYCTDGKTGQLGDGWLDGGDGYFYYTQPLAAGAATDALFDEIVLGTDMENGDGETTYAVTVVAYAVQAQGVLPEGISRIDAASLPAVQTFFNTAFAE